MWPNTAVTKLFNIKFPIVQAPMAGVTTPALVAAVSNAGGLGSLAAGYLQPHEIENAIIKIRQFTDRPFSVNLFVPGKYTVTTHQIEQSKKTVHLCCPELHFDMVDVGPPYLPSFEGQLDVLLRLKAPIISFTFGALPDGWKAPLKKNGALLVGTATLLEEALLLEEQGMDAIVVQGLEAGGHRGTFLKKAEEALVPTLSLVRTCSKDIKAPIIAAGGAMDGKCIIELITAGASAVQMGTAFLCCDESGAHPAYKETLLKKTDVQTTLTRAFSGKLARGITNPFILRMHAYEQDIVDYPVQHALTRAMRQAAYEQSNVDFMSMWAGQNVFLCRAMPAGQLIKKLYEEALVALKKNRRKKIFKWALATLCFIVLFITVVTHLYGLYD